jgi:hypothetical protein
MALLTLNLSRLRIQKIISLLLAPLFALIVVRDVNTTKERGKHDASYSDTGTREAVLVRSRSKKRCRGVVVTVVLAIAYGFTTIGFVVWKCRYDNRSVLLIQPHLQNGNFNSSLKRKDHFFHVDHLRLFFQNATIDSSVMWEHNPVLTMYGCSVADGNSYRRGLVHLNQLSNYEWVVQKVDLILGLEGRTQSVHPSDVWLPSDLELSMMTSTISPVDDLVFAAPVYVGQIGQDRSAQNQAKAGPYDADIAMQGMSSLLRRELEHYKP